MTTPPEFAAGFLGTYDGRSELRGFYPDGRPHPEPAVMRRFEVRADDEGPYLDLPFGRVRIEPYNVSTAWVLSSEHETTGPDGAPIRVRVRGGLFALVGAQATYSIGLTIEHEGRPRIDGHVNFEGVRDAVGRSSRAALH